MSPVKTHCLRLIRSNRLSECKLSGDDILDELFFVIKFYRFFLSSSTLFIFLRFYFCYENYMFKSRILARFCAKISTFWCKYFTLKLDTGGRGVFSLSVIFVFVHFSNLNSYFPLKK